MSKNENTPPEPMKAEEIKEVPPYPWSDGGKIDQKNIAPAQAQWRTAFLPALQAIEENIKRPRPLQLYDIRQVSTFVQTLTLVHQGQVGQMEVTPEYVTWALPNRVRVKDFEGSQCSNQDRRDVIKWLGQHVARVNWRTDGRGSAPTAVAACSRLMLHWTASAWHKREAPEWCKSEVAFVCGQVYPESDRIHVYRPWSEAREDIHTFLMAWSEEREQLGPRRPRKNNPKHSGETSTEMANQLTLLRAFAITYPQEIDADDLKIVQKMNHLINMSQKVWVDCHNIIQSLEDLKYLEDGLKDVPAETEERSKTRRRRI